MPRYDIQDYIPKEYRQTPSEGADGQCEDTAEVSDDTRVMDQLDLSPEQTVDTPDKNAPQSGADTTPSWSRYVSAFFSPLLVTTYTMAFIMWVTPLAENPERVRFLSTVMVFLITAVAPMAYILTMVRIRRFKSVDIPCRRHRFEPALVSIMCLACSVLYLSRINAPDWLMMVPATFGICAAVYIIVNTRRMISGPAMNIGAMTGIILYLGCEGLIYVNPTVCVACCVALTGLVCSARMAVGHHRIADVVSGSLVGFGLGFGSMFLPLIKL